MRKVYVTPAIIYETIMEVRAGSALSSPHSDVVEPDARYDAWSARDAERKQERAEANAAAYYTEPDWD